jgi:glucokinase
MNALQNRDYFLVGDIGGTNARFALADESGIHHLEVLSGPTFDSLQPAMAAYFEKVAMPKPAKACICVACPITGDHVQLTNLHWQFSISEVQSQMGFEAFQVFNDFTALALSLPFLKEGDRFALGPEVLGKPASPIVVVGPGTGLGVSALIPTGSGDDWIPIAGEGGHVSFAPSNEVEDKVLLMMRQKVGGRISAERILSGMGLEDLHLCLVESGAIKGGPLKAHEITNQALAGDSNAAKTLNMFCEILGSLAGDLALTFGAHGGVYIGGGIIPRVQDFAAQSGFRERFEDKGRMSALTKKIPTWLITNPTPALIGMHEWLKRHS